MKMYTQDNKYASSTLVLNNEVLYNSGLTQKYLLKKAMSLPSFGLPKSTVLYLSYLKSKSHLSTHYLPININTLVPCLSDLFLSTKSFLS